MIEESVILNVIPSQNHRIFVKRKINSRRKFDVFWNSLLQKYKEEELDECIASLQLTTYKIKRAKKLTLLQMLCLDQEVRKRLNETMLSSSDIFKYYSKFVNNLFQCLVNHNKYLQQRTLRGIRIPHRLFHGTTTTFLPNIAKQGLLLGKTGQNWEEDKDNKLKKVCLTDSLYPAEFFALYAIQKFSGEAIVLKINVEGLEERMQIMCETLVEDGGAATVFGRYFEFFFTEPIPPDRIKISYILPKLPAYALFSYFIDCYNQSVTQNKKMHCQSANNSVVKII